jgi:hypothetical protein
MLGYETLVMSDVTQGDEMSGGGNMQFIWANEQESSSIFVQIAPKFDLHTTF